ncbi:MAG TPA: sigma-70 family RNA polymerase sigma factor [Verrucomicrobiae bacterium]|jgi:RNA polymerase sigma factor (sigma-70 family)|nr:sigma-70 family RNA polymerase sigma factor [Verrucomicrobiae bacterium]
MTNDADLLGQFIREPATAAGQDAFATLVERHLNLVYSAALRQVRSAQLAEEISQSVFTQLACHAPALKAGTVLAAWLHRVTHHAAIDVLRREGRRQAREQIACEMSRLMDDNPVDWTRIEPILDQAVQSLSEADRAAIIMRFFENKSLREVGESLGTNEDAAQKRVSRALERLREHFVRHKITGAAAGLAAIISAHAVQAAPVGLSGTIVKGSLAVSIPVSTSLTTAKIIAMTTLQKVAVGVVLAGAAVTIAYQHHQFSQLQQQTEALVKQETGNQALNARITQLQQERDNATNELASLKEENAALKSRPAEVLKLRGEVGQLRGEKDQLGATTAISKMTATPEARQLLHDSQKIGMGIFYKQFAEKMKLTPEQTEKFNDLLADNIMQQIDDVTAALRDKTPSDQLNQKFAGENTSLDQKIQELLGADSLTQYKDYTKNLLSSLTAQQFQSSFTGSDAEKAAKAEQLRQAIQQESQSTLANASLPPDYQTLPILNLVNIASEDQANQSLNIMEGIYQRVIANASYLSPDEITKLRSFLDKAVANNKAALSMNRTLMAPISSQ